MPLLYLQIHVAHLIYQPFILQLEFSFYELVWHEELRFFLCLQLLDELLLLSVAIRMEGGEGS